MTSYAYILRNPDDWVYVGATRALVTRILAHNGRTEDGNKSAAPHACGSRYTRSGRKPWRIIHYEEFDGRGAEEREQQWLATLAHTGTLPFLDFTPADWGPKTHPGHRKRPSVRPAGREAEGEPD